MAFILYIVAGFVSGIFGGMGMGGGTILIPILTIFLNVNQQVAQATNLLTFLPMAAVSLRVHSRQGLLKKEGAMPIILSALITAVAGGLAAIILPAKSLKKIFGLFLIFIALLKVKDVVYAHKNKQN